MFVFVSGTPLCVVWYTPRSIPPNQPTLFSHPGRAKKNTKTKVSGALQPGGGGDGDGGGGGKAFQECVLIRHPRVGEYAIGFITGRTVLQTGDGQDVRLSSVYVPTNHVYVGVRAE